jgi:predicted adenylyl cyclase CyaB
MIEVEVRGRLTEEEYNELNGFLKEHGEFVEHQDREMILLRDYPGYSPDFVGRDTDIRLRNTNGNCEIMLKRKVSGLARNEISLKLQDSNLDSAKEIMKALGCTTGIWMHRIKDVYNYRAVEWSVVKAPKGNYYFEVEQEAAYSAAIEQINRFIRREAEALGLTVFNDQQTREYIAHLDKEVNEVIEL